MAGIFYVPPGDVVMDKEAIHWLDVQRQKALLERQGMIEPLFAHQLPDDEQKGIAMSLYLYLVEVDEATADAWQVYVDHSQSLGLMSSHQCWQSDCIPEGIDLNKGICLGRPMCNDFADEIEHWYGKHVLGDTDSPFTEDLIYGLPGASRREGPDERALEWIQQRMGKTVILCNDNEI
jgi:hypothetical protein